jgi:peptidyl-prolyl cis-trans isomerase D
LEGDFVLEHFRKSQRWLTAIFIFAIGIVFVFFLGLGGSSPPLGSSSTNGQEVVISLDDDTIQVSDYLRVRDQQEQRLRSSLGDQFDADAFGQFIDTQALQSLVNQMVLSHSALELGLVATPEEVKNLLRNDPSLRDSEGRFDQENFNANIKWTYGSQAIFLESMQRDLLQQKMYELLVSQGEVSEAEALSAARYQTEEVRIAYIALDAQKLPLALQPGDDAIKSYFDDNQESLRSIYDAVEDRFGNPEQVRMRHIVFTPDSDLGEEAEAKNREQAEQVLARVEQGEDFAELALEFSDDPSSSRNGGELGLIGRGDVPSELEVVAFALEPGKPSQIVDGPEGLHIIVIDEKIEATRTDFAEAGMVLAAESAAEEAAKQLAEDLSEAVAANQSLEDAGRAAGLTLERTDFFARRRDGFIPSLGRPSLEILSTAFSLTPEAASSKQVFEVGNQHVLIQLLERKDPDPETLDAAIAAAKESLPTQLQSTLIQAWIDNRREEYESQQRLQINAALIADL